MFVSQLEPHHQNDRKSYEGYKETVSDFKNCPIPKDLSFLSGDYEKWYPNYISAVNRLDYDVGKLIDKLKALNIYENTIIIYTSDHGCHFKTRNSEYKRSCHESSIHTPLIIRGGVFKGDAKEKMLTSLIDLPPTLLSLAGLKIPEQFKGKSIDKMMENKDEKRDGVFIQISESQCARAIRTERYKYSVRDLSPAGYLHSNSKIYFEDYLYDLEKDPIEKFNLIRDNKYFKTRQELKNLLINEMLEAGEKKPVIFPALFKRKK